MGHQRRSRITRHTSGLPLTVNRRGLTRADPRTRLIASLGGASFRDERLAALVFPPRFPGFASWLRSRGRLGWLVIAGFPSGRLTSSNVATWVLSAQDSNTAPQTSQDTWPLCGIKHVGSMRLYSAPHSHRTSVVSILENARGRGQGPGDGGATPRKGFASLLQRA